MNLALTTITGYAASATFLFLFVPYMIRNRRSWVWLPSRFVYFLFGDNMPAAVLGLIIQVIVPAFAVAWLAVSILHLLF